MLKKNFSITLSATALMAVTLMHSSFLWAETDESSAPRTVTSPSQLHPEMWDKIFSYLPVKDVASISRVSRAFHELAEHESTWNRFLQILDIDQPEDVPAKTLVRMFSDPEVFNTLIGAHDFPFQNFPACLNDTLVEMGYSQALENKIYGLCYGRRGYAQDTGAAHNLLDELIQKEDDWALMRKLDGLTNGQYGYAQDPEAARDLIEKWATNAKDWALMKKFEGLAKGRHGYTQDLEAALDLLEKWAAEGNSWAIDEKLDGLVNGWYGYTQDLEAAHNLIEKWAAEGKYDFIMLKIRALTYGLYNYTLNFEEANILLNQLIDKGHDWAIIYKHFYHISPSNDDNAHSAENRKLIENLIANEKNVGIHIYIRSKLEGRHGFEKDKQILERYVKFLEAVRRYGPPQ